MFFSATFSKKKKDLNTHKSKNIVSKNGNLLFYEESVYANEKAYFKWNKTTVKAKMWYEVIIQFKKYFIKMERIPDSIWSKIPSKRLILYVAEIEI